LGSIVGGFATSHTLFPSRNVEAAAARVLDGMMRLRSAVARLAPDVLVVANSDHMNNFTLARQITFAVGVADEYLPLGDMGIPQQRFRGSRELGTAFARHAATRGFDVVAAEEVRPDHGMMITKLIAAPDPRLAVVPVYINTNMPVVPAPQRAFELGQVLAEAIGAGPWERAVVVAGGGLSHWLCTPEEGRVNEAFDRHFLELMSAGRAAELARLSVTELEAAAGNGGLELANWLFMAGTLPRARGETFYYEPIPAWITGMGGLALYP